MCFSAFVAYSFTIPSITRITYALCFERKSVNASWCQSMTFCCTAWIFLFKNWLYLTLIKKYRLNKKCLKYLKKKLSIELLGLILGWQQFQLLILTINFFFSVDLVSHYHCCNSVHFYNSSKIIFLKFELILIFERKITGFVYGSWYGELFG